VSGQWRIGRTARGIVAAGLWAGIGGGSVLLASVALPSVVGFRSLTVMSGSMAPAIHTGDVVVTRPIPPLAARVGDVVTFQDPSRPDRLITHRVREVRASGATVEFETKGDANNATERWQVPADGRIGRVVYKVPALGYLVYWTQSRYGRLAFIALPAFALGALTLAWAWRPSREEPVETTVAEPALDLPSPSGLPQEAASPAGPGLIPGDLPEEQLPASAGQGSTVAVAPFVWATFDGSPSTGEGSQPEHAFAPPIQAQLEPALAQVDGGRTPEGTR
jgi:signal peptidase I